MIAFVCSIDGKWSRIGYVVKEVADKVHEAIRDNKIISVKFAWIKYITNWPNSGPGYFTGISITMDCGVQGSQQVKASLDGHHIMVHLTF